MGFKENLKEELLYQDKKVKELAAETGISINTINHYFQTSNPTQPQAEVAVKIAKALNTTVEYLVTGKHTKVTDNLKPKVIELIKDINRLTDEDIELLKIIINRLK